MPQLHYTTTPVMGMSLPVPGVTDALGKEAPGASWMELQNSAFGILDQHNHAPGSGAAVPSSGLTINADLPFQVHNATQLRAAKFAIWGFPLSPATDTAALYVSGQDLYFNDVGGNVVRLTASGGVAGTPGSIAGLTSPAAATYTPASKLFDLTSGSGVRANLWTGPLSIYDPQAAGHKATLQVPVGLGADYALTLPSTLPGSTLPLFLASTGQLSTSGQVQTAQIANLAVTAAQVANNTLTRAQFASVGQQVSGSSGAFNTVTNVVQDIPNMSVTITTSGRPVVLAMLAEPGDGTAYISNILSPPGAQLRLILQRAGVTIAETVTGNTSGSTATQFNPPGTLAVDVVGAGTYVYKMRAQVTGADPGIVNHCILAAWEL
jgi:hypothetical protein